jgi:hypothetical protein
MDLDIFKQIEMGVWDDDDSLDAIIQAAVARRKFLRDSQGAQNMAEFKHGDAVRLINIRPKYLAGKTGTVDKTRMPSRSGDIMVRIDDRHYRNMSHRYSQTLSIPASSLERV